MSDEPVTSPSAEPAGAATATPAPEAPASTPTPAAIPAPTVEQPTVPSWVNQIDQVPQPQQPMYQYPPAQYQPGYQGYQPPQYPQPAPPQQASLDAIAADPNLVSRLIEQGSRQVASQMVAPVMQAMQQQSYMQFQQQASQAVNFAKNNLAQVAARDASLSNPHVAQGVQQAYATLIRNVQMGNPQAVAALAAPELPYALIAIAKANANFSPGAPVSYTGAAVETGRGAPTTSKPALSPEEESLRQEWGGDAAGYTVDKWIEAMKGDG